MEEKKKAKMTWQDFKRVPWWTRLFIVACIALPITTLGGALPMVMALFGIQLCVKVSLTTVMKTPIKLLLCFGITAAAWGIAYLFPWVMAKTLSSLPLLTVA